MEAVSSVGVIQVAVQVFWGVLVACLEVVASLEELAAHWAVRGGKAEPQFPAGSEYPNKVAPLDELSC